MATQFPDLFAALAAPFEAHEVKTRAQAGRQLHYITARTAMNRLDSVLGPENWWDHYTPMENSVVCALTARLPDGALVTKCDAGGYAGMQDQGDDDKSGFSDAFKRAAAKFGVARYLYRDGVPFYASHEHEHEAAPPQEPARAARPATQGGGGGMNGSATPRSGKALFAWTKEMEQKHEVGLLRHLNNWAKLQDYPGRMVDWDAEQVALAHAEAVSKLQAVAAGADGREPGQDG